MSFHDVNLQWPCFLTDCVSELWQPNEICAEFWNRSSKSSKNLKTLTYGQFKQYTSELTSFLDQYSPFVFKQNPIILIVWKPHILIPVIIYGICHSNSSIFLPTTIESFHKTFLLCANHIAVIIYLFHPVKHELPLNFVKYCPNSQDGCLFHRSDWCLFIRDSFIKNNDNNSIQLSSCVKLPNTKPAYVMTTSGSFGNKTKLICIAHSCITANIVDLARRFRQSENARQHCVLLSSSLTFDASFIQIYFALATHRCLIIPNLKMISDFKSIGRLCTNAQVDWLHCTPSQFINMNQPERIKLLMQSNLNIVFGGETFPMYLLNKITHYQASLFNIYGTTENSAWSTLCCLSLSNSQFKSVTCSCSPPICGASPIGFPMLGSQIIHLDSHLKDIFELQLARDNGGYFILYPNANSMTTDEYQTVLDNLSNVTTWTTGDLVCQGSCGKCLWFVSRKDRLCKRMGSDICLEQLEHALQTCWTLRYYINRCRCQISSRKNCRDVLIAFVELNPGCQFVDRRKLKLKIMHNLKRIFEPNSKPWLPDHISICCQLSLPISQNGKLIFHPLSFVKSSPLINVYIERLCNKLFGSILSNDTFKVSKSNYCTFVELGGNSLMAVSVVEQLVVKFPHLKRKRTQLLSMIFSKPFQSFCKFIVQHSNIDRIVKCHSVKSYCKNSNDLNNSSKLHCERFLKKILKIDGKSIFERNSNAIVVSLNADTVELELVWSRYLKECVDASALIFSSPDAQHVFVGSHAGLLAGLQLTSGFPVWSKPTLDLDERIESSAGYLHYTSNVLLSVGTLKGNLIVVDYETGNKLGSFDVGGAIKSPALFSTEYNLVFIGSHAKCVQALDFRSPASAQCVWSNAIDQSPIFAPVQLIHKPISGQDLLLVASLGGTVAILDPRNPTQFVWSHANLAPIFSKPVVYFNEHTSEARLCVGCVNGYINSWCLLDGQTNWAFRDFDHINLFSDPIITGSSQLIWTSNKGTVFGLDLNCGTLNWNRQVLCNGSPSSLNTPSVFYIDQKAYLVITGADGLLSVCPMPLKDDSEELVQMVSYQMPNKCFSSPVLCPSLDSDKLWIVNGCRDNCVHGFCISNKNH